MKKIVYAFAIVFALVLICPIAIASPVLPVPLVFTDIDLGAAATLVPNAKATLARARKIELATNMKSTDCNCLVCPYMNSNQTQGYWRLL